MSAALERTEAYILRSVDYKESDRILTLFTRHYGKVSAIARYARSSRKRFGGALEPFALLEVELAPSRGRGDLLRLDGARLLTSHYRLSADLERLGVAAFVLELVREFFTDRQPEPRVFELVSAAFASLTSDRSVCARSLALMAQMRILAIAGFAVSAGSCTICSKPAPPGRSTYFDPSRGGVVCTSCGGGPRLLSAAAADLLKALSTMRALDAEGLSVAPSLLGEVEDVLDDFTRQHCERQLRTPAFRVQVGERGGRGV